MCVFCVLCIGEFSRWPCRIADTDTRIHVAKTEHYNNHVLCCDVCEWTIQVHCIWYTVECHWQREYNGSRQALLIQMWHENFARGRQSSRCVHCNDASHADRVHCMSAYIFVEYYQWDRVSNVEFRRLIVSPLFACRSKKWQMHFGISTAYTQPQHCQQHIL